MYHVLIEDSSNNEWLEENYLTLPNLGPWMTEQLAKFQALGHTVKVTIHSA